MPQTRFVTQKALAHGLRRSSSSTRSTATAPGRTGCWTRPSTCSIGSGASDEQLDFPVVYASALATGLGAGIWNLGPRRRTATWTPLFRHHRRSRAGARGRPRGAVPAAGQRARLLLRRRDRHRPHRRAAASGATAGHRGRRRRRHAQRPDAATILGFHGLERIEWERRRPATSSPLPGSTSSTSPTPSAIPSGPEALPAAGGRRADHHHDLPGQQLAVRRARRQVRHQPADSARAPRAGS